PPSSAIYTLSLHDALPIFTHSYDQDISDEFIVPFAIVEDGKPVATIDSGDSLIFFNFRPDRSIQLTSAFIREDFTGFPLSAKHPDRKSTRLNSSHVKISYA